MNNLLSLVSGNSSPLGLPGGAAPSVQSDLSFAELVSAPPVQMPEKVPFSAGRQTALATIFENTQSIVQAGPAASAPAHGPGLALATTPTPTPTPASAPAPAIRPIPTPDAGPVLGADALSLGSAATPLKIAGLDKPLPATASAEGLSPPHAAIDAPIADGQAAPAEVVLESGGQQAPDVESIVPPVRAPSSPDVKTDKPKAPVAGPNDQPGLAAELKPVQEVTGERVQPSTDQASDPVATETPPSDRPGSEPDTRPAQIAAPDLQQTNEALPAFGIALPSPAPAARRTVDADGDPKPVEKATGDSSPPPVARNDRHQPADATALRSSLAKAPDSGGGTSDFAQLLQGNGGETAAPAIDDRAGGTDMLAQFRVDPAKSPAEIVRPAGVVPETISARPGEIGRQLGVEIVRQNLDGRDSLTIRLDPAEMGEIQVRLQFDDKGTIRAHVSAESSVALEMLRRDSGDLVRALGDAGVRTDAQSFQFEARSQGRGDQQGQHNRPEMAARQDAAHAEAGAENDNQPLRAKLRSSGSLDLFA